MRPPDIHGEFVPVEDFTADPSWEKELLAHLESTLDRAAEFAELLCDHTELDSADVMMPPKDLLEVLRNEARRSEVVKVGLGHTLAEAGVLPMYGMPTRVRPL